MCRCDGHANRVPVVPGFLCATDIDRTRKLILGEDDVRTDEHPVLQEGGLVYEGVALHCAFGPVITPGPTNGPRPIMELSPMRANSHSWAKCQMWVSDPMGGALVDVRQLRDHRSSAYSRILISTLPLGG